jgi:hypothetical protein
MDRVGGPALECRSRRSAVTRSRLKLERGGSEPYSSTIATTSRKAADPHVPLSQHTAVAELPGQLGWQSLLPVTLSWTKHSQPTFRHLWPGDPAGRVLPALGGGISTGPSPMVPFSSSIQLTPLWCCSDVQVYRKR